MRSGLLVVALGACRFEPGALRPDGQGQVDASAPDVSPDMALAAPYCDAADPDLLACYAFEGDAMDSSSHGLNASLLNVTFVPGRVGMAMQFDATSVADVGENALLDPPFITIEAWIKTTLLPATGLRMGILDNNGQYGFFLYEGGNLRCIASNTVSQTNGSITPGEWHHVACTHDGSTTTVYADGVMVGQITGGAALGTGGITGMSIAADNPPGSGSRLIGQIDQLRMFSVARTGPEICEDAGACAP